VLSTSVSGLTAGTYPIYQVVVRANANPLDNANWVSDLRSINITVNPSTTTNNGSGDGQGLYTQYCESCHGKTYPRAASASAIRVAINRDDGGMGILRFLTDTQLNSIATYMQGLTGRRF
jgi:mono/diheme cytochrome c family protein